MKAVISYRYNGEVIKDLEALLISVCNALKTIGVDPYCVYFEHFNKECDKTPAEMMQMAFSYIDKSDFLFVIQTSEARSEGMLMEIGYAIAKGTKVVVATKLGVENTYLPSMADYSISYLDINDLVRLIKQTNFNKLEIKNNSSGLQNIIV